jgi:hypothetical protein
VQVQHCQPAADFFVAEFLCRCSGVQVLAFFIYNFLTNFILEPTYQTCFNATLQRLKLDPRVTVRLGNDIVGKAQLQQRARALQCAYQLPNLSHACCLHACSHPAGHCEGRGAEQLNAPGPARGLHCVFELT